MSNFTDVFEDFEALFTNYIAQIDNLSQVSIKIIANNRLKEIGKIVKANDLLNYLTQEDVIILLNEEIFEQLIPDQQLMVVEELVAQIYFDMDKDKVVIVKPDVNTFSLLLRKYGYDKYEALHLTIKSLYSKEVSEAAENNQPA